VENISDFGLFFYLCGPEKFVNDLQNILIDLGADIESLVIEK
jgi:hypothetical protein